MYWIVLIFSIKLQQHQNWRLGKNILTKFFKTGSKWWFWNLLANWSMTYYISNILHEITAAKRLKITFINCVCVCVCMCVCVYVCECVCVCVCVCVCFEVSWILCVFFWIHHFINLFIKIIINVFEIIKTDCGPKVFGKVFIR